MLTKIHLRNFKGITGTFKLGKITSLFGKNGTGKSAILEAIKIGLTGYTELGKLAGKTFQLSSDKAMEITLESAMGRTLTRKFEKSGSGAKQTISLNGEPINETDLQLPGCFSYPVEAIHPSEFLSLSDEKQAEFIFAALGEDINSISPEDLSENYDFFNEKTDFSRVLEIFKHQKSKNEKEIKRCLANIQKLTGEMGEMPAGNLKEWEEKKQTAYAELEKIVGEISGNEEKAKLAVSKADHLSRLQKNLKDSEEKIASTQAKIEELQNSIKEVKPLEKSLNSLLAEKEKVAATFNINGHKVSDLTKKIEALQNEKKCPLCGTCSDALDEAVFILDSELFNATEALEENQKELDAIQRQINDATVVEKQLLTNKTCENSLKVEKDALKCYQESNKKYADELEKLNSDNDEAPVSLDILKAKAEGCRAQIKEAEENIKKLVSVRSIREQKSKSEEERIQLENQLDLIKKGLDEIKTIRDTRLADATVKLAEPFKIIVESAFDCPAYLTMISKNDKPCFDFGIVKNEKEISFNTLSGGEKTIVLSALVACLQIVKTGQPGIGLFEMAEADTNSFESFLKATKVIGFEQIIIASCHSMGVVDPEAVNIEMGVAA